VCTILCHYSTLFTLTHPTTSLLPRVFFHRAKNGRFLTSINVFCTYQIVVFHRFSPLFAFNRRFRGSEALFHANGSLFSSFLFCYSVENNPPNLAFSWLLNLNHGTIDHAINKYRRPHCHTST
jgi:hypothetical protein